MNVMHVSHVSNGYGTRMQRTASDELFLFIREVYVNYNPFNIYLVLININEVIIIKYCSTIFIQRNIQLNKNCR